MSDPDRPYRTRDEEAIWQARDPIIKLGQQIVSTGGATQEALDVIAAEAQQEMLDGVEFARAAPYPRPEEASWS